MRLRVFTPARVVVDETVHKVVAEGEDGSFGMLPRHIDFLSSLQPGLVAFVDEDGEERFVAVDSGTLVKRGDSVDIATPQAERCESLAEIEKIVARSFRVRDERERRAATALARLEADFISRLTEMGHES